MCARRCFDERQVGYMKKLIDNLVEQANSSEASVSPTLSSISPLRHLFNRFIASVSKLLAHKKKGVDGNTGLRKIIAVDFDGTLCKNRYPDIGTPKRRIIRKLLRLREKEGYLLVLWTCRGDVRLDEAIAACKDWGIVFDAINENPKEHLEYFKNDCRKIGADQYWDDRSVRIR